MKYEILRDFDSPGSYGFGKVGILERDSLKKDDQLQPSPAEARDELQKTLLTGIVLDIVSKEEIEGGLKGSAEARAILKGEMNLAELSQKYYKSVKEIEDDYFGLKIPIRDKLIEELKTGKGLMLDEVINTDENKRIGIIWYCHGTMTVYDDDKILHQRSLSDLGFGTGSEARREVLNAIKTGNISLQKIIEVVDSIRDYEYYRYWLK